MAYFKTRLQAWRRIPRIFINLHFWIVLLLFGGSIILHYPQLIPFIDPVEPSSFLYLTRYSLGRLLLLLPITYAGLVFGLRAGLASLGVALLIMAPNIFFLAQTTTDDIIETIGIVIIGLVVILWLESYEIDKGHRLQAFLRLETAQRELQRMQQNLRFYLKQILIAQEEERRRIAQELHDDTAQALVVLSRKLDDFIATADHQSPQNSAYLKELQQQTDRILNGVRRFSQDLRPSVLDDLGLLPALEWLIPDLAQHFGIAIDMKVLGSVRRFPPEPELILFRIAQEALRNVGKHSQATKARVTLDFGDDKAILTINDNGDGFKPPERIGDLAAAGKLGLTGMQERAQLIGGSLRLESQPGKGTTVIAEVPILDSLQKNLV